MKVVVMGSDYRMREVYYRFASYVETILINETSDLHEIKGFDVLVLPVRAVDAQGNLCFPNTLVKSDEAFWKQAEKGMIFAGSRCPFLDQLDNQIYYYMEEEALKKQNAILTAEGILYYMIDHTATSIFALKVDIIGKGICGSAFGTLLRQLGIRHRYVRRAVQGEDEITIEAWKQSKAGDVVIITAPVEIIDEAWLYAQQHHPLLIDIASGKVVDAHTAGKLGFPYVKALGIPSIFAAKSAGNILFEWIWGKVHEE